ncbi:MAG: DNA cytosine methyltransferase [Glaciimonas sp.]|nr:DNA cytosine methyltransferase [Glaciimonas sp.]
MKVVDLFSGCGGLSLGFEGAGLNINAAFDWWDPAIAVYRENISHPIFKQDLSDVDASVKLISAFRPDMIIGGPPCQDFSHAGKRNEGNRANLTIAYSEIIAAIRPKYFVMENVGRAQNSIAFKDAERTFREAGYGLTMTVLDASLCGVPQKRKRFFCIGKLGEANGFLSCILASHQSDRPMTIREYFGDEFGIDHYYRHPRNYSRRAIFSIDEPAPTVRGVNRPIAPGYSKHAGDPVDLKGLRPLTTDERAQLQTFPLNFKWLGTKTDKEQMIGNAVPVDLAKFVAKCIIEYEAKLLPSGEEAFMKNKEKFRKWLIATEGLTLRSTNDVVSRMNRASRLVDVESENDIEDIVFKLGKQEEFKAFSMSVRSQLRRAVCLYRDFQTADAV